MTLAQLSLFLGIALFLALLLAVFLGFRVAAKHEAYVKFVSDSVPRDRIKEALHELGWSLKLETADHIVASTKVSWQSWGEAVSIRFDGRGAQVKSECSFPMQVFDWGRNRMNIQRLTKSFKEKNV